MFRVPALPHWQIGQPPVGPIARGPDACAAQTQRSNTVKIQDDALLLCVANSSSHNLNGWSGGSFSLRESGRLENVGIELLGQKLWVGLPQDPGAGYG